VRPDDIQPGHGRTRRSGRDRHPPRRRAVPVEVDQSEDLVSVEVLHRLKHGPAVVRKGGVEALFGVLRAEGLLERGARR
jgi:hypothetical protein